MKFDKYLAGFKQDLLELDNIENISELLTEEELQLLLADLTS